MSRRIPSFATLLLLATPVVLMVGGTSAAAQDDRTVVVTVRDSAGKTIPYALVQQVNGAVRTADDSGRASLPIEPKDSLRFVVRRIGFEAFSGWVARSVAGDYPVVMAPLVQSLKVQRILAQTNDMLVRNRFYDRMERARRGAYTARFITPEELDLRNPSRISSMMQAETFIKVKIDRGRAMLLGRSMNCPMTVLLDGRRVAGMVEEFFTDDGQREIERLMRGMQIKYDEATQIFLTARLTVDEIVTSHAIAAIEMYSSLAAAPSELQQNASKESCGLIALWTGSRR